MRLGLRRASERDGLGLRSAPRAVRGGRFPSFDLTFESHRSTHTILECPAALWGLPSLLDSEGLSEREERGTTHH
jgi:hypothetical protein